MQEHVWRLHHLNELPQKPIANFLLDDTDQEWKRSAA